MIDQSLIKENMEIVGRDGEPVGNVAGVEDGRIRLAGDGSTGGGDRHIELSKVDFIEDGRLCLNEPASDVLSSLRDEGARGDLKDGASAGRSEGDAIVDEGGHGRADPEGSEGRVPDGQDRVFVDEPYEVAAGDRTREGPEDGGRLDLDEDGTDRRRSGDAVDRSLLKERTDGGRDAVSVDDENDPADRESATGKR